ncbi:glycosyltransferase [Candidatus Mycolicibacterium alkanivorans]|uniref:Glycosyltransferase n=1 Tax=Candidatus Mycolicibacterium alkanivorans TaxID=2954114 RepID=A0ABS9YQD8_9MYCO|nr:glycosyltransferase [Candidatus Mycolicibacterium alkanivorans]MCI4673498.1 glycosyltransferase [Candidatus Mycolicibacterium alkanivorans]
MTRRGFSGSPTIGVLSTHPPTRCGLATFSSALSRGLRAGGATVNTVRIADGSTCDDTEVVGELISGSAASVAATAELLNRCDVALVQHEYGIYGGPDGDEVVDILRALRVPTIVVAHTVVREPTAHQRWVLEAIAAEADQIVVMSEAASGRLSTGYDVDRRKVAMIPHGAAVATDFRVRRAGRPTLLSWGLLGPGKGIERVIDAMASLQNLPGRPRYVVAGRTHPKVLAAQGEAYRESLRERARSRGVADAVNLETGYLGAESLRALIQSAAAVVLPYDSTDQVTSGVLVEAIAKGRPVVATAFPHAVELLSSGAGIVVNHQDPDALELALRRVLTQPGLAGAMAAEARHLAPSVDWPVVADTYLALAQRLCASRSALL